MSPRVSVVIPAYERGDVVGRAIDSALAQTVGDIEVLVVDDGSTDDTAAVVGRYDDERVRYLAHERNRGVSAARNTGVETARGDYVAFLDSDDEWLPRKLARQLDAVADRGEGWVGAYCDTAAPESALARLETTLSRRLFSRPRTLEGGDELARELLCLRVFMGPGSTLLAERDAVTSVGGFSEVLAIYEDWDLVVRLLARGKLAHVAEPLALVHDTGDAPGDAYARNDAVFLDRNAERARAVGLDPADVRRVHRLGVLGHYLREGSFRDALAYRDALSPSLRDAVRVGWWSLLGARARWGDRDARRTDAAGGVT